MSEGTYNQELSPHQLREQALAIKRTIIDAWISDFPQTPPWPEPLSPPRHRKLQGVEEENAEPPRGRRRKLQDMMEVEDAEPLRRSKRNFSPLERFDPPKPPTLKKVSQSPIKKQQPAARARGRGGKISQPRPQPGGTVSPIATSNYQQRMGSITLAAETTLNSSVGQTVESRASSPTRTRQDLENAVPTIICRGFTASMVTDMREDVRSLRKDLMKAARHYGILPVSIRDTLYPLLGEWDQNDLLFDQFPRSKKDEDVVWAAIQDIYIKAQKCGELDKPESSWSHEVIRPLLKHSLKYTPWQDRVQVEIIDSVSISPTDLVPKDANGVKFKLKKVDCALFLTPHPHFHAKIKQRLMALPDKDRSINQTSADFIKNLPLIASFELKRQSLGTDPLVQLGIWSAALAERLGKLQGQGKESELMAMPVVSIVDHDWKVYYSYTTEEGEQMLRGPDTLGSTTDFVSIYSIMKAIQMIAKFGVEVYMPWFEQYILDS